MFELVDRDVLSESDGGIPRSVKMGRYEASPSVAIHIGTPLNKRNRNIAPRLVTTNAKSRPDALARPIVNTRYATLPLSSICDRYTKSTIRTSVASKNRVST